MGAWLRNLGLLFIVGAGWLTLSACPSPDWQNWGGIRVPLAGPRLTADAVFTAPHTATYFVQVKLPPEAKAGLINNLTRPPSGERGKPILCRIFEDGRIVENGGYRSRAVPAYDGPSHTLGVFTGEAGHTYQMRVQVDQASADFIKAHPFVDITYNPLVESRRHRHYGRYFLSALFLGVGLLLTFWCGSRVPLRTLLPPAS